MDRLELLSEVDALRQQLDGWANALPDWQAAETCRALVRRLGQRVESLRVRLEAPLVVATLGGTGTGKSALVNALVGSEVVQAGRRRPTTIRPVLICRPELGPEMLGIDPRTVEVVHRDVAALSDVVLIDCPDPDTTEADEQPSGTNLARLRELLPHCDVLLVATTQQKYRSARVAEELAQAAKGARLVFVQTHADVDEDVRSDWREVLSDQYTMGHVFLVDSPAALADAQAGLQPRGEFAELVDLLTRQLAGTAAARIRRANFLDLVAQTLSRCRRRMDEAIGPVRATQAAIEQQRTRLAARLAEQMQGELLASRRPWENRLLGQVAARWGLSPFSLVLRVYQGLGGLLAGSLLFRARTPAQMALWGAVGGVRAWQKRRQQQQAEQSVDRAVAGCWDAGELRSAAIVLGGHAAEAGLQRQAAEYQTLAAEAEQAGAEFVARASGELESLVARLARRHCGWFTRCFYELLLCAMLGVVLYRLGKNFFYDSWLAADPVGVFGIDFYVSAGFWLTLWCLVLLWLFSGRLRRGLRREIDVLAEQWKSPTAAAGVLVRLEDDCRRVEQSRRDLDRLEQHVGRLRRQLALPDGTLGHRRAG
ncbi:MAG: GTPase domain-containing protein [Pirellulales bacterium]|nr:GTPase domain-containing protein [Pirellulales bacterium]